MNLRKMEVRYNDKDTNETKNVIVRGSKAANEKVEELKRLGHKEVWWIALWQ